MFTIEVTDDVSPRIYGLSATVGDVMDKLVRETSETMMPFLKENTPIGHRYTFDGAMVEGGQLRDSLEWDVGMYGAKLIGAKQGEYVIGGTAPHDIFPKVRPALAFFWPKVGVGVFFKHVHHPGTKPNDFRETSIQQAFDEMAIQDETDRIMTQWVAGGAT